jgi:hypothetical protein
MGEPTSNLAANSSVQRSSRSSRLGAAPRFLNEPRSAFVRCFSFASVIPKMMAVYPSVSFVRFAMTETALMSRTVTRWTVPSSV